MIRQAPSANYPLSSTVWQQWLAEVAATGKVLSYIDPTNPRFGKAEPPHMRGLLAYANGTDWNPGSGEGYYRWTGTAWHYMG
jgi:hypothetical protein